MYWNRGVWGDEGMEVNKIEKYFEYLRELSKIKIYVCKIINIKRIFI